MTRTDQLLQAVPDVLQFKSLLYIGASKRRQHLLPLFARHKYRITVLEIWPRNAIFVAKHVRGIDRVVCGDARNACKLILPGPFDVVLWWHGPEHVAAHDLAPTLVNLEELTRRVIVLASPWGRYDQAAVDGNPHERHLTCLYPDVYTSLGYTTSTLGQVDVRGSNLLAWKRVQ